MGLRKGCILLISTASLLLYVIQAPAADLDFGVVLKQYQNLSGAFGAALTTAARWLILILIVIDVAWSMSSMVLKGAGTHDIAVHLLVRVVWYGFLLLLISSNYLSALVLGFKTLGEDASGLAVVTPGAVFWKGVDLITTITTNFESGSTLLGTPVPAGLAALTNPFVAFALGLSIILILLAYTVMTAQYVMILVQMYFYLAVAPLLLSFGALAQGKDLALKAVSGGLAIGVRLLAIYFVLAVANGMAPTIGAELAVSGIDNMGPIWAAVGLSALLALLAIKVPTLASDVLGGSASLSGADMFAPAAMGAAVGTAVTNGLTQVLEKYFGQLGSGAGSIAAAGASSPTSYVTAAQQAAASAPSAGSDYGYASSVPGSTFTRAEGLPSALSLSEMQARHDQELGFTPSKGAAGEGGTVPEASTTSGSASGPRQTGGSPAPTGIGSVFPDAFQDALNDLAQAEQAPPASIHIEKPDDHEEAHS